MISAYSRGHKIIWDAIKRVWLYYDTLTEYDDSRSCVRCGKYKTAEGYDACIGYIEGAVSICCGHGMQEGIHKKHL
jgi:hypothetical protein